MISLVGWMLAEVVVNGRLAFCEPPLVKADKSMASPTIRTRFILSRLLGDR